MFQKRKHFLAALTAVSVWGFISIPVKKLAPYNPFDILFYRLIIAFCIMMVVVALFRKKNLKTDINFFRNSYVQEKKRLILLIVGSSALITANWYSYIFTIVNINVQVAALSYVICPILTAIAAYFILKEHLKHRQWFAIFIASISIILLIKGSFLGIFAAFFTASTYAIYLILQKKLYQFDKFNLLMVQLLFSVILLSPILFFEEKLPLFVNTFWLNVSIIAILFTIIPMFLTNYSLLGVDSSTIGILIYVSPILSFILAFTYFNESVTVRQCLAYAILTVAVFIFNFNRNRHVESLCTKKDENVQEIPSDH